jgi:hypothetical protein
MPERASTPRLVDARIVVDACVLFPVWSCDVLLTAQEVGLVESVIATPEIIEEALRNALDRYPDKSESITRRFDAVSRFVEGGRMTPPPTEVDDVTWINAKDRHVLTAACRYEADIVITVDGGLYAELNAWAGAKERDAPLWSALTTDEFFALLAQQSPAKVAFLLRRMAGRRRNPPMTELDLLFYLRERLPSLRSFDLPGRNS